MKIIKNMNNLLLLGIFLLFPFLKYVFEDFFIRYQIVEYSATLFIFFLLFIWYVTINKYYGDYFKKNDIKIKGEKLFIFNILFLFTYINFNYITLTVLKLWSLNDFSEIYFPFQIYFLISYAYIIYHLAKMVSIIEKKNIFLMFVIISIPPVGILIVQPLLNKLK